MVHLRNRLQPSQCSFTLFSRWLSDICTGTRHKVELTQGYVFGPLDQLVPNNQNREEGNGKVGRYKRAGVEAMDERCEPREQDHNGSDTETIVSEIWLEWCDIRQRPPVDALGLHPIMESEVREQNAAPGEHSTDCRHVCKVTKRGSRTLLWRSREEAEGREQSRDQHAHPWKTIPLAKLSEPLVEKARCVTSSVQAVQCPRIDVQDCDSRAPSRSQQRGVDDARERRDPRVLDCNNERRLGSRGVEVEGGVCGTDNQAYEKRTRDVEEDKSHVYRFDRLGHGTSGVGRLCRRHGSHLGPNESKGRGNENREESQKPSPSTADALELHKAPSLVPVPEPNRFTMWSSSSGDDDGNDDQPDDSDDFDTGGPEFDFSKDSCPAKVNTDLVSACPQYHLPQQQA